MKDNQVIEIEYLYKDQTCWFYYPESLTVSYETAVKRAEKHFKILTTTSGWNDTVIVAIRPQIHKNENKIKTLNVTDKVLPTGRAKSDAPTQRRKTTARVKPQSARKKPTTKEINDRPNTITK